VRKDLVSFHFSIKMYTRGKASRTKQYNEYGEARRSAFDEVNA